MVQRQLAIEIEPSRYSQGPTHGIDCSHSQQVPDLQHHLEPQEHLVPEAAGPRQALAQGHSGLEVGVFLVAAVAGPVVEADHSHQSQERSFDTSGSSVVSPTSF